MSQVDYGGTNTSVIGYTDVWVNSTGVPLPSGRNQMFDGTTVCQVVSLGAYVSGRSAARNISLSMGGNSTGTFSVGSASSAAYTGQAGCSYLTNGGTSTFQINSSGSFYYGRGGSGNTHDNNGLNRTDGSLFVQQSYVSAPTPPTAPGVSPSGATGASVVWSVPSDNGDGAISGYRLQYSTDNTFATGVTSVEVGNVLSYVVTGLTPGATYYFRVQAENSATVAYGSWSLSSTTVSLLIGTAPSAPTAPAAHAYAGRLEVDWTSPGGTISNFVVDLSTDNFATVLSTTTFASTASAGTITGLTPGTLYYARVRAVNVVGASPNSTVVSATIPARNALSLVRGAAVDISGGYQVELRSDGANSPTITLGYIPIGSSAFTAIATIALGGTSANHAAVGGLRNLALVADPTGSLYVIGRRGDDGSTVLVKYFARTAPAVWGAPRATSQALPNTGDSLIEFAATYVAGTGLSPVASIMLLARRAGTLGAGSLSYALLSVAWIQATGGTQLFIASGSDPAFLGTPPTVGSNTGTVDVAPLVAGGTRLALLGNSWGIVDVINGVITAVVADSNGANSVGIGWARILGVSSTAFALFTVTTGGVLSWAYYSTSGSLLGSGTYAAANAFGGAFTDQWDVYENTVANVATVYYVTSTAGARSLSSINVSPATYAAAAAVALTAALGSASTTNSSLRVPEGYNDERQTTVSAANLNGSTKTVASFSDTNGNVAPNAPSLVVTSGFDATQPFIFAWTPSDPNPADSQFDYEIQVQRVSDNVNLVATGQVASAVTNYTMAANVLANAVAYRWCVRTTDALGVVGAWSAYSAFTTSAIGTLTITSPATDDVAGVNTSSVPIVWTYSQVNGYTQTQRRVLVTRTSDGAILSDTTMQASTVGNYTITGLLSDTEYAVQVSIITNAPGTPTVTQTRLVTPSFAAPDTPTVTITPGASTLTVAIGNPTPTGSRPSVLENDLYRRLTGSGAAFVRVAVLPVNGAYVDHAVASGTSYDYQVITISTAVPATSVEVLAVGVAPALMGAWIYDPTNPAGESQYAYANKRTETLTIATAVTKLQGRVNPIVEYGVDEEVDIAANLTIPLDGNHDAAVQWIRQLYANRRIFMYRDNRGRRQWSAISTPPVITDATHGGSEVALVLTQVDYSEAV
jgi:hypothetical protein